MSNLVIEVININDINETIQSIGPYTEYTGTPANNKKVFEPWQGRNIILTDAKNTGVYDIVFDSDKRFSLGTSILTNRDFWETLTLNKQLTVSQFISPEKNNLYADPAGSTFIEIDPEMDGYKIDMVMGGGCIWECVSTVPKGTPFDPVVPQAIPGKKK